MCFDAVAAFGQAPETELIFTEAPEEHRAKVGQHELWQCLKVREGRLIGARAWHDRFVDTLLSTECPGTFKQSLKSPNDLSRERVRDRFRLACRRRQHDRTSRKDDGGVRLSRGKIVLKLSPIIGVGTSFEH